MQREMRLFEHAGVSLPAIWSMATNVSGEGLRVPQLGSIANDAPADLMVFRAFAHSEKARLEPDALRLRTAAEVEAWLREATTRFDGSR
jgi:cytosine/adenosine deaminase-related metal-dependent hydrolase